MSTKNENGTIEKSCASPIEEIEGTYATNPSCSSNGCSVYTSSGDYKPTMEVEGTVSDWQTVTNINKSTGEYVTHLFFCDPHASCQKGSLEKNHEFIRYILPKGSSLKNINQKNCDLIMNNINSLCRDSLNGKSPYEAMLFLCDENVLKILNCYYIKPDEIILNETLLKD